ncbi:MAG: hypothetical protein IPN80_13425 [Flavobacterium sp.]|nr:hypothetical protein [Flavobacterium sp.]
MVCENDNTAIDLFSLINGEQTGGTWVRSSGTGGVFDAATARYTPAAGATNSTFTYTIIGTPPCVDSSSLATIDINAQPNAGVDGAVAICDSSTTAIDLFSLITAEQSGSLDKNRWNRRKLQWGFRHFYSSCWSHYQYICLHFKRYITMYG